MKTIILSALLMSVPALAEDFAIENTFAFSQTTCKLGNSKAIMYLRFDKQGSVGNSDYSGAPLVFLKGENAITVEGKPGDYSFIKPREKSVCDKTVAYPVGGNDVAIFYSKDNRPFQDKYMVLIVDLQSLRVIEKRELGAVSDLFATKTGFAYATTIPRSDADQIEVTGGHSGEKIVASDQDLKAIQTARLENDVLKVGFDPALSYKRSNWKRYFKTQDEYLQAAGWDSAKGSFTNVVVYQGNHFNRKESDMEESCLAMTNKRGGHIANSDWRCIKEQH